MRHPQGAAFLMSMKNVLFPIKCIHGIVYAS